MEPIRKHFIGFFILVKTSQWRDKSAFPIFNRMETRLSEECGYFIIHFALISFLISSTRKKKYFFHNSVGGHGKWTLFPDILYYELHCDNHFEREMEVSAIKKALTPKLQ